MFNNLSSTLKKVFVIFLIITLINANLVLIGSSIIKGLFSYAVEAQETNTNSNGEEDLNNVETNETEEVKEGEVLLLNVKNKDIHKTRINEGEVQHSENIILKLDNITDTASIMIENIENKVYKVDEVYDENAVIKYNYTTINKANLLSVLGDEGKLLITDTSTNKIVGEITKDILLKQNLNEEVGHKFIYKVVNDDTKEEILQEEIRTKITVTEEFVKIGYVIDVQKIKFELTNITIEENENTVTELIFENVKTISNLIDIDEVSYLQEITKYEIGEKQETISTKVLFKDTITRATLEVDNTNWLVGQANTVKYTINLDTTTEKYELFTNPMLLIELPSSVESVNTANSEFVVNNNNGAFASKRVFITTVLGKKFVVVTLEGTQTEETIAYGNTTIDLTLELNVSAEETEGNQTTKLYYQNDTVTAYESGKGFDTAEVTVAMVMASEPKEDIEEVILPDISLVASPSIEEILKPEDDFTYNVYVYNFENIEYENLKINNVLPTGVTLKEVVEVLDGEGTEADYNYDNTTRALTINIDKIAAAAEKEVENDIVTVAGSRSFKIKVSVDALEEGTNRREVRSVFTLSDSEKVLRTSQEIVDTVAVVDLSAGLDELPEQINELEKITLGIKVMNNGLIDVNDVDVKVETPEEISLRKYKTTSIAEDGQETATGEGTIAADFNKENLTIKANTGYYIKLEGKVNQIEETKTVTIKAIVNGEAFTWDIKLVDLDETTENPEEPSNPEDPEKPSNPETPEEPETPENPENPNAPENPEKPTNPDNPTKPDDSEDIVDTFDLSLNQYINKITVTNSKGTTTYEYKDTNFAKVEIHAKQMNGSKVTLEYKIVVKNEGTVPGYARKIVNYIPSDLKFNEELNKGWYLGDDGNIYSVEFLNKLLNPGETAEISLILEKQMTNENVGTITNILEIYEATNNKNLEDVNSIPGDRLEGQNDISKVEVLIVTSTGTIILYTTLAITVLTIIVFGFYKVKKVTLNKKGGC